MSNPKSNDVSREDMEKLLEDKKEELSETQGFIDFYSHMIKDDAYWERWKKKPIKINVDQVVHI